MPAHAIFLRAVNVGGHALRPKELATALSLDNIGAAGTYVCRDRRSPAALRKALAAAIPYPTEIVVVPAAELVAANEALARHPTLEGTQRYVTLLAGEPAARPRLPLERPAGTWQVRVVDVEGRFVLSLHRRGTERRLVYPNEVIERELGCAATTRNQRTIDTVLARLAKG